MKINTLPFFFTLHADKYWYTFVLLLACLLPFDASANCIKELNYRILEERSFALEENVDLSTLRDLDILRGKPTMQFADVNLCIDENGLITKTSIFTYEADTYYPNRIHRTVETPAGFEAFDVQGNLILNSPNDPAEIAEIPGMGKELTPTEIADFGVNLNFANWVPAFESHFISNGGSSWSAGTKNYFSSTAQDVIIAEGEHYMLSSNYDHSGELQSMFLQTAMERNGYYIPQYEIRFDYDDLLNGSKMRTAMKETYLNYTVVENGQTILQYTQADHPYLQDFPKGTNNENKTGFYSFKMPKRLQPEITLFPNPTFDLINIQLNETWIGKSGDWSIRSATGQTLLSGIKTAGQEILAIRLPVDSSPGIYLFQLNNAGTFISKKFVIAK